MTQHIWLPLILHHNVRRILPRIPRFAATMASRTEDQARRILSRLASASHLLHHNLNSILISVNLRRSALDYRQMLLPPHFQARPTLKRPRGRLALQLGQMAHFHHNNRLEQARWRHLKDL
jgi:hypothetical protein